MSTDRPTAKPFVPVPVPAWLLDAVTGLIMSVYEAGLADGAPKVGPAPAADGPTSAADEEILLTVSEAVRVLRRSTSSVYPLISSGDLPSIKVGRRRLVRRSDLLAWIDRIPADPSPSTAYVPSLDQLSRWASARGLELRECDDADPIPAQDVSRRARQG